MSLPLHDPAALAAFVRANTQPVATPLLPEIRLHLATEVTPLWEATEDSMKTANLPPPYWAFAWAGGQAVSRHVLDNPGLVAGKRVFDFASGSGVVAIACMLAGAASVTAAEIDPLAVQAIALNAAANGVAVEVASDDRIGGDLAGYDILLAGDVCYERPMADRVTGWFRRLAEAGMPVILGDPGRAYLPGRGLEPLARYAVPTTKEIEDREVRDTTVWRMVPGAPPA
jgi:predicted nicotinamide N-methyase